MYKINPPIFAVLTVLTFILCSFVLSPKLFAQTKSHIQEVTDSNTPPLFDYPLHVGNVWVYGWYDYFTYTPRERWKVLDNWEVDNDGQCGLIERIYGTSFVGFTVEEFTLCMIDNMLFNLDDRYRISAADSGYYPVVDFNREEEEFWIVQEIRDDGNFYYEVSILSGRIINSEQQTFTVLIESTFFDENLESALGKYWVSSYESGIGQTFLNNEGDLMGSVIDGVVSGDTTYVYTTNIDDVLVDVPMAFGLSAYPNPFNPSTVIQYQVPVSTRITVQVFTVLGELVETLLANEMVGTGSHSVSWSPSSELSSGVYVVRMQGDGFVESSKVTLVK